MGNGRGMNRNDLEVDPQNNTPAGLLWQWFRAFKGETVGGRKQGGIANVGNAGYSKIGHYVWPNQVPLVDSVVVKFWTSNDLWVELYDQLNLHQAWFAELERLIEVYRMTYQSGDGVPIQRLRCADLITWIKGSGQWYETLDAGRQLLSTCAPVSTW